MEEDSRGTELGNVIRIDDEPMSGGASIWVGSCGGRSRDPFGFAQGRR
jgi:hypothetical protein